MIRICTSAQWPQGLGKGFASFGFGGGGDLGRYPFSWLRAFAEPLLQLRFPMRLATQYHTDGVLGFDSARGSLRPISCGSTYVPSLGWLGGLQGWVLPTTIITAARFDSGRCFGGYLALGAGFHLRRHASVLASAGGGVRRRGSLRCLRTQLGTTCLPSLGVLAVPWGAGDLT